MDVRGMLPGGVLFAAPDVSDVQEGEGVARRARGRLRWATFLNVEGNPTAAELAARKGFG